MQVLGTVVLIKPDKLPERTPSGKLIINPNSKEMLPETGVVVQAGSMCTRIKEGDKVKFPRKSSSVAVIDGEDFYFINEHKVYYNE